MTSAQCQDVEVLFQSQTLAGEWGTTLILIPEGFEATSVDASSSSFDVYSIGESDQGGGLWRCDYGTEGTATIVLQAYYTPNGGGEECYWYHSFTVYPDSGCCEPGVAWQANATCETASDGSALLYAINDWLYPGNVDLLYSTGTPTNQINETGDDGDLLLTNLSPGDYWVGFDGAYQKVSKIVINPQHDTEGPNFSLDFLQLVDENNENASLEVDFQFLADGFILSSDFYNGPLDGDPILLTEMSAGVYPFTVAHDESDCIWELSFEIPEYLVFGCMDESACNFNPEANQSDNSCTYPGCTVEDAPNYDPDAGCDDGSCELDQDFNGDGDVGADDLLIIIGELGCQGNDCLADLNGDLLVNVQDILILLNVFGYGTD